MADYIINIILVVIGVIITLFTYYFQIKSKLQEAVNGKINDAEVQGVKGEDKINQVVNELYNIVPKAYRCVFTKEFIKTLTQKAFDKIEEYAKKQVNRNW